MVKKQMTSVPLIVELYATLDSELFVNDHDECSGVTIASKMHLTLCFDYYDSLNAVANLGHRDLLAIYISQIYLVSPAA